MRNRLVDEWFENCTRLRTDIENGLDLELSEFNVNGAEEMLSKAQLRKDTPTDKVYGEIKEAAENIAKAIERKNTPVYSGCVAYFPLALKEIAKASAQGQKQHNPDKPLAWDRSKSGDELDAMMRHLLDHSSGEEVDDDGVRHIVKCGWRILAFIQKTMENEGQHYK